MTEKDRSKLIEVYKGSLWQAELVKSLINNSDIDAALKDALVVNLALPTSVVDVSVLVNEIDFEAAMEVVREYEKNTEGD